ncbi:MAG: GNAT family N-acetyltransferase [Ignavibacteriales bacterium]|nr:GNAT family N-acetyltransferase [Ignavibacteriales bacterium]
MIRLETKRLLFRDHDKADLELYCEMESDPEYRFPQTVHPRSELERSFRETWLIPKPMGLLATVLKSDGCYIGRCGLYPHRNEDDQIIPGEANIAFYLARPYWGQGFATEAGKAFIEFGFNNLGLSRIEAGMNANNLASIRVVQKLGFVWVQSGEGGGSSWHEFELRNPTTNR